jgi:hypothetical protein
MQAKGDANKKVWVTEVGWNSAKGKPNPGCVPNDEMVTEQEQADYLYRSFHILLDEVPAVQKVFWYQYMDTGTQHLSCPSSSTSNGNTAIAVGSMPMDWRGYVPAGIDYISLAANPNSRWEFGLYRGDKVSLKPAGCAFKLYPDECIKVFLPLILR